MPETEVLLELIRQRADEDRHRYAEVTKRLSEIDAKVTILMESRTLVRGAWKATALIAGLVSGLVSVVSGIFGWWTR